MKLIVQPDAGMLPVIRAIKHARKAVHVCIFRFDRDAIEHELQQAVVRGVLVRALIANTNRGGEARLRKLEQRLLAAGVTVTRSANDLLRYHGKFMVADDTLHVFGFNFTKLDIDKSRSFGIATRDRKAVQEALKLFDADSTRRDYVPSRSNLVVSPDTARAMLTAFIRGARKELAIYDQKVQDPVMVKLLKDRAAKGVRVRVLGTAKGSNGNIEVRALKGLRLHVRAVIRDGTRAFVGSQSLRKEELDSRREVGLLISNPTVTGQLMKVFEADWLASATKEEKKEEKAPNAKAEPRDERKVDPKAEPRGEKKTEKEEKDEQKEEKEEKAST